MRASILAVLISSATLAWAGPTEDLAACQAQAAATAQRFTELQRALDKTAALANFYATKYAEAQSTLERLMEARSPSPLPPVAPPPVNP